MRTRRNVVRAALVVAALAALAGCAAASRAVGDSGGMGGTGNRDACANERAADRDECRERRRSP